MTREEYELRKIQIEQTHYECVERYNIQAQELNRNRESEWRYYQRELDKLNKQFFDDDQR